MKKLLIAFLILFSLNASATNFISNSDGTWNGNNWTPSSLSNLQDGDTITMNHSISISGNINLTSLDLTIIINETLDLSGSKSSFLRLGSGSQIILTNNGTMISDEKGNNNKVKIGSTVYSENELINFPPNTTLTENSALPVELLYFTVKYDGDKAILKWETAWERDNDYYTIEKSDDGNYWVTDRFVFANSTGKYEVIDRNPEQEFYRLSQTDIDGTQEYLEIKRLRLDSQKVNGIMIPNSENVISVYYIGINGIRSKEKKDGINILVVETDRKRYTKKILQ